MLTRPITLEFIRFGLVGVVNTVIDLLAFIFLFRIVGINPLLANTISFFIAVTNSYLLNQRWTFRHQTTRPGLLGYLAFVAVNGGGLIIGILAIMLLGKLMAVELAKLIAAALTLLWNYSSSRLFVFKAPPL